MCINIDVETLKSEIEQQLSDLRITPMLLASGFVAGTLGRVQIQIRLTTDSDEFLEVDEDDAASNIFTSDK